MTTLFYETFQNTNNWITGSSINIVKDPQNLYNSAATFATVTTGPSAFSNLINSAYKSFTVSFDYLGIPKNQIVSLNLGCVLSIADGASLTDYTMAYAGAIKNSYPPIGDSYLCLPSQNSNGDYCAWRFYTKTSSLALLTDDSNWHHYSLSFSTNNNNIRIALGDFTFSNYPEGNNPGDCYFANLLVTDSYGPSPYIATSSPENFRSISVDILDQVADTVSYENSNAAININLGSNSASGGYASADVLTDISNIIGSSYADIILGNNKNNILSGGDGNDSLTAGVGQDILIGGNGSDKFIISTDISNAVIKDFEINNDIIDLRLFNNLNNFQDIKLASQYSNGDTIINLGNSRTITLSGINYNDLSASNFIINTLPPTLSPTNIPTIIPTKIPTLGPTQAPIMSPTAVPTEFPTFGPTKTPTINPTVVPTAPTFVPSLYPTISPSLIPTLAPTDLPTIIPTKSPSSNPSQIPTVNPSASPTGLYLTVINIEIGGAYSGNSASEHLIIDSPLAVKVTGGEGIDKFTILPRNSVTYTIDDFDPTRETIDLVNCGILGLNEITFSDTNPVILTLKNDQMIKLEGLKAEDIAFGNFIFSSSLSPTNAPTIFPTASPSEEAVEKASTEISRGEVVGISIGALFLGIGIASTYFMCARWNHFWPFSSSEKQVAPACKFTGVMENEYGANLVGETPVAEVVT